MPLEVERIVADEQLLEPVDAQHVVARRDAGHAFIGQDAGDERRECAAWSGIPAWAEGRIERDSVLGELDIGDLHASTNA